jgi:hypothetical protein
MIHGHGASQTGHRHKLCIFEVRQVSGTALADRTMDEIDGLCRTDLENASTAISAPGPKVPSLTHVVHRHR